MGTELLQPILFGGSLPTQLPAEKEPTVLKPKQLISHLRGLDLKANWGKYEKQGFKKCAVFDADGTLWKGDLSKVTVDKVLANKAVSEDALPKYNEILHFFSQPTSDNVYQAYGNLSQAFFSNELFRAGEKMGLSKAQVFSKFLGLWNYIFIGYTADEIRSVVSGVFASEGFNGKVFYGISDIMQYLREEGIQIYVISAGVHPVVVAGVEEANLGINASHVQGTDNVVVDGKIKGEIKDPVMDQKGKPKQALDFCGGRPFMAFGDSVGSSDALMLKGAHIAVAVEPSAKHAEAASKKGYLILDFEKTVSGELADTFPVNKK